MDLFKNRPKRKNESALMEYLELILEMRAKHYTFREIKEYIEDHFKINIGSLQNLMKFYKRHTAKTEVNRNFGINKPQKEVITKAENINILSKPIDEEKGKPSDTTMDLLKVLGNTENEQAQKLIQRRNRKS